MIEMGFSYLIDTNLLVLLTVGSASESFIEKHRRTNIYTVNDFILLNLLLSQADRLIVIPNVLSETSNLIRQFANPGRDLISESFRRIADKANEEYVKSVDAVYKQEFIRLGLTDAALLSVVTENIKLITDDFDLYIASISNGIEAVNFSHEREDFLGV